MNVRYPEMRHQVLAAVTALADPGYQQRVWVDRIYPRVNYYDDLDSNIHILFDDTGVLPDPEPAVGQILTGPAETESFRVLGGILDPIITELGDAPDSRYLSHSRWPEVIRAARSTLAMMTEAVSSAADG